MFMKKRYSLSLSEISLIELSDVFATLAIVGFLLTFFSSVSVSFLIDWKWVFLLLGIIFAIKPARIIFSSEKKVNDNVTKTSKKKIIKKKVTRKKR